MKKVFKTAILALIVLLAFSSCRKSDESSKENADLLTTVEERGKLYIGTEGTWAPWTYHDESNALVGFDVEVATRIAEIMGLEPVFYESEWDGLFAGLNSGRYDIVANGVEVTDERAQAYDFSEPYAYINTVIIVRDDNDDIKSFEDLEGKTTANTLASTYSLLAESYGAKATGVDSLADTILLVEQGRVDATLNADVSFFDYMKVHTDAPLKIVAETDTPSKVSIPVRKGEPEFLEAIDDAIVQLRESGELREISIKYFGSDVTE